MKPVLLKDVRKGEYFTLTNNVKCNEDGEVLLKYVYVRSDYDREEKKYEVYKFDDIIVRAMEMRCPFSLAFPLEADDITDLLEEFGQDNDLPEDWWCEYGDIDDIVEQL